MSANPFQLSPRRGAIGMPHSPVAAVELSPDPQLGRSMIVALATIVLGFGGFFVWAAWAELSSAAIAPGVVVVESHRKVVQHLEGGLVKAVRVANGDHVRIGDPLVELDDTQIRASYGLTLGQQRAALARQARLRAEALNLSAIEFPEALRAQAGDPEIARLIETQLWTFKSRRNAHDSAVDLKRQAIADLKADLASLTEQLGTTQQQIDRIHEEILDTRSLLAKGLVPKPRVLALERAEAELRGRMADLRGRIMRNREALITVDVQINDLQAVRQKDVALELEAIDKELADLAQRLGGLQDVLRRIVVTAPQDGVVVNLQVFTAGGVIRAGDPILELVPGKDALVVDARVNPLDIDTVRRGLTARIRLTAFKQQTTPAVTASVVDVSADRLTDQAGNPYYTARLRLDQAELDRLPNVHLSPGMPVDALIITGERSALDYLLSPITNGFAHALREK